MHQTLPRMLSATANKLQAIAKNHSQYTLALLKPDLLANNVHVRQIINEIDRTQNVEIRLRRQVFWTRSKAEQFYAEHNGKFFFNRLVEYMTSGPFEALALSGPKVISQWREMLGKTHPVRMRLFQPNSLRARYGLTDTRNSFHGSDSYESAERELRLVFGNNDYEKLILKQQI